MVATIAPEPGFDYASATVTVSCASRDGAATGRCRVVGPVANGTVTKRARTPLHLSVTARLRSGCLDRSCAFDLLQQRCQDRKSTRLNSSHTIISYAGF